MKCEDTMLILGANYTPNVVIFSMWFLQLRACIFEMPVVASHVIESDSLLTEPGAVIKFSDFSSHPGTRMLILCTEHDSGTAVLYAKFKGPSIAVPCC